MNRYRIGCIEAWEQAEKEFPKNAVQRKRRFAELLRQAQGLDPVKPVVVEFTHPWERLS